jgi:hypothetical protein
MDDAERRELVKLRAERELVLALAAHRITSEGAKILPQCFADRIVDGVVMQADFKTPAAGSGSDGSATVQDLADEAVKRYPMMFYGTGAGGGGATGRGGRTRTYLTRGEFDALPPAEQMAAAKSGKTIAD